MLLTRYEEEALVGRHGDIMQTAYRILVATGEAIDAPRLVPVEWVHLSGVNYNTIGDAGEEFLRSIRGRATVKVRTTLNPMGFDVDNVQYFGMDEEFVQKQLSIKKSYAMMGVEMSFSCIPYDIFPMPISGTQVALAESNAAIHANSLDGLYTNKESAFSALASALTGKSPQGPLRQETPPDAEIQMAVPDPTEVEWGMLGYFAGHHCEGHAAISGAGRPDVRSCKAICGGMGTSGTCGRFSFGTGGGHIIQFGREELASVCDQLNTAEKGDLIILGSPQLSWDEVSGLVHMLAGRRFVKKCLVFCPRTVKEKAVQTGYAAILEKANCMLLADCCACLTPLVSSDHVDAVTTNSIKGAYYMGRSNKVGVCIKPLRQIIREDTL